MTRKTSDSGPNVVLGSASEPIPPPPWWAISTGPSAGPSTSTSSLAPLMSTNMRAPQESEGSVGLTVGPGLDDTEEPQQPFEPDEPGADRDARHCAQMARSARSTLPPTTARMSSSEKPCRTSQPQMLAKFSVGFSRPST